MKFYLGTHEVRWLEREEFADVPLFVSAVRLRGRKSLPRAKGRWALDSGGFMTIRQHGHYPTKPSEYAREVRRWRDEIGGLDWAAIQDWMCEDVMLAKTRMTIGQHQQLTVNSYLALNACDGELPWIPILQGQSVDDYHRHADLWERHTCVRLEREPSRVKPHAGSCANCAVFALQWRARLLRGIEEAMSRGRQEVMW